MEKQQIEQVKKKYTKRNLIFLGLIVTFVIGGLFLMERTNVINIFPDKQKGVIKYSITDPTNIIASGSTVNSKTYDTATVTLTANRWYTLTIHGYSSGGGELVSSVVQDPDGTPLSFTKITDAGVSYGIRRIEVWAVRPTSTTANAKITITWDTTESASGWSLTEWSAGVNSTDFSAQVQTNSGSGGTSSSVTMSSFADSNNAVFFVTGIGSGSSDPSDNIVEAEGRSELADIDDGERGEHADHYQNPNGADTSLTASWTGTLDWGAIGIEVRSEGGGASNCWSGSLSAGSILSIPAGCVYHSP